jgi:putative transposase
LRAAIPVQPFHADVYLRAFAGVTQARASIGRYLSFCNGKRPHSSPGGKTPDQACINLAVPIPAAA